MTDQRARSIRVLTAVLLCVAGLGLPSGVTDTAAAHCGAHSETLDWKTGGTSPDGAKTLQPSTTLNLPSEGATGTVTRWFRMYIDEPAGAVVADDWCFRSTLAYDLRILLYEKSGGELRKVGSWADRHDQSPRARLPVLDSGWYYVKISIKMLDSGSSISFDIAEPGPSDFTIGSIDQFPENLQIGEEVTFVTEISKNRSVGEYLNDNKNGPFTDRATVSLLVDDRILESTTVNVSLKAGESTEVDLTHTFTDGDVGTNNVSVLIRPHWADRGVSRSVTVKVQGGSGADDTTTRERAQTGTKPTTRDSGQTTSGEQLAIDNEKLNLLLNAHRTKIASDEKAVLSFSATNLISNDRPLTVQLILEAPSDMSVSGIDSANGGPGQYSRTFTLAPGESDGIELKLSAGSPGQFKVTGHAVYYFRSNKNNATTRTVTFPIQVSAVENSRARDTRAASSDLLTGGSDPTGHRLRDIGVIGAAIAVTILFWLRS